MNLPIAPLFAAVLGAAAAIGAALLPAPVLEGLVMDSGVASVIAAAEPPLSASAHAALVLGAGGLVALLVWLTLFVLLGTRSLSLGGSATGRRSSLSSGVRTPVLRRADAHPDAPPRPPLLATRDLGTPFLEVHAGGKAPEPVVVEDVPLAIGPSEAARPEPVAAMSLKPDFVAEAPEPAAISAKVEQGEPGIALSSAAESVIEAAPENFTKVAPIEQEVPADLEQPLSAFDPAAILPVPLPPSVPVAPLHRPRPQIFNENERFEAFELVPPIADVPAPKVKTPPILAPEPLAKPETEASVHALLDRLERGVSRKSLASRETAHRREAERGLEDTLATLRNLARGNSITA